MGFTTHHLLAPRSSMGRAIVPSVPSPTHSHLGKKYYITCKYCPAAHNHNMMFWHSPFLIIANVPCSRHYDIDVSALFLPIHDAEISEIYFYQRSYSSRCKITMPQELFRLINVSWLNIFFISGPLLRYTLLYLIPKSKSLHQMFQVS
jgi:hypothetical protein